MFNEKQKKVLGLLLDKYEKSKTYSGNNKVTQNFEILPNRVFESYNSDYANVDHVRDFEYQMMELENKGLIRVKRNELIIEKLIANPNEWDVYYEILQRVDKRTQQNAQLKLYSKYLGINDILDLICYEQIDKLEHNKKTTYGFNDAECILQLCQFVLKNQKEILERELSIAVLGDSKLWEKKYRTKVCDLLRRHVGFDELLSGLNVREDREDKREMERIILAEYQVFSNPSYVYFKGNAEFCFNDGTLIDISLNTPIAFSTDTLKNLRSVKIMDQKVITVENLTSFNRLKQKNTFFIFLSGYHNSAKQKLIHEIYNANIEMSWFHFGDIDPDGFYIIEHLKTGTGIKFEPLFMDIKTIDKYKYYTKKLTNNDIRKAKSMLKNKKHCEIMEYMLKNGLKLEQEIISWMEN